MIVELAVENLAIIERSQLRLGPGFTALTGETGAGKSLLIDAINLALGNRADSELVRDGAAKATVRLVMDLDDSPTGLHACEELGVPLEESMLYVNREVTSGGRSTVRLGGSLAPVGTLKQLGQSLVDLHGQHDHQSLLDEDRHLSFLDDWIGAELIPFKAQVVKSLGEARMAHRRLEELRRGLRDRTQRIDALEYAIQEIEAADPKPGEFAELEGQFARLKHAERLSDGVNAALAVLCDADPAASDGIGEALRQTESLVRVDETLDEVLVPLREAKVQVDEAIYGLRAYLDRFADEGGRLDVVAERIDRLKRLRRKYGDSEEEVLESLARAKGELELLSDAENSEETLREELRASRESLARACDALTAARRPHAERFAQQVQAHLQDLAMTRAIFEVRIAPKEPDEDGADAVTFAFSANVGEPPRPLAKIASGGEISRVMLAIKSAMAGRGGVPTLIFDEVDAGLGGRAAATVAKKLKALGRHYQVVAITHSPQIASQADDHFRIEKVEKGGRVVTQVGPLTIQEREREIARMLAGEVITETALANAREMLSGA